MPQNRNKLIEIFIGNLSNAVLHKILENAINNKEVETRYKQESITSLALAKKYREKINPLQIPLPLKDTANIKSKVTRKVKAELLLRMSKGYENINISLIEPLIEEALKETNVVK